MISNLYAMAGSGANQAAPSAGMGATLIPMMVIFFIFYFVLIRPQKKRELSHKQFLEGLKKGDEVLTHAGLMGRIAGITESVVTLDLGQNMKVKMLKSAIAGENNLEKGSK